MASVLNANLQQYRTTFEKGIKNVAACFVAWSLSVNNGIYRMLCFVQNVMEGLAPYMFTSHTKMSIIFRKSRSTNYIYFLKACKRNKVHGRSREITSEQCRS